MSPSPSLVIVGAGHAGVQLALSLRQGGFAGTIRLVNNEPHPPYQRPPLSKGYLKAGEGAESLWFRSPALYADQGITLVADAAEAIDRAAMGVRLRSGASLPYDQLVLATGARTRRLGVPGSGADIAYLRTLEDTERLRRRLPEARRVAVVGAGFIGLEFAATARALGKMVDVIDVAPRVMARAVSPPISAFFEARHEAAGVGFHLGVGLAAVERREGEICALVLADGTRIPADLVVAGIGVVPDMDLAAAAGLETASGVVVDEYLRTTDPAISAIGDCASFPSIHAGGRTRIESVQNATDQARCVAARLLGRPAPYASLPWFWSDQGPDKLQIAGLTAGHDLAVRRGDPAAGAFSVFCYAGGRLVGVESVNRAADHVLGRKILSGARSIPPEAVADLDADLRRFAA